MRIAVVGTGYVGLVAGTCFAESGNTVVCVDIDQKKIEGLKAGRIPIYEPGLEEMVKHNVTEERLTFSTSTPDAVRASDVIFIAVGTPPGEDGSADLKYVLAVAKEVGKAANGPKILVDKSTVPVGTAAKVKATAQAETSHPMTVVSNPEFLKEGAAIERAADSTYFMSALPSSPGGVPTAMNATCAPGIASSYFVVNDRRPSWTLRLSSSSRPGS